MKTQQDIADALALHARGLSVDGKLVAADVKALDQLAASLWSRYPVPAALQPGPDAIALIEEFEGCAKRQADGTFAAYPDPGTGAEPWTIGWGSTGADITRDTVWSQRQCDVRRDQFVAELGVKILLAIDGAATTQHQFDALVDFAYNLGIGNLRSSTLLKLHRAGDHAGASAEFPKWNRAAGKVLPGLVKRRAAEAALYGRAA